VTVAVQTSRMKLGAIFPQIELAGDPAALRGFAIAAEDLGYDHLVMYDHLVGVSPEDRDPPLPGPYAERDPFHDPLTAFAFVAGITERIELVTGILILPQRQTVLVARQSADVDLMSGGRLRLGVGAGYNPFEFQALGMGFADRGRRLSEQIPYLRRLWREELIDFDGEFHQIDRANLVPRPGRDIPIWCGGSSEPAFRRAVRLADGFIFSYGLGEDAARAWIRVQELLAEANRPVEEFGAQFLLHPPGSPHDEGELVDGLHRLEGSGATHAAINTMYRGFTEVAEHIEYLATVKRAWNGEGG
jgi:probable F420-dependent oxidoreductase